MLFVRWLEAMVYGALMRATGRWAADVGLVEAGQDPAAAVKAAVAGAIKDKPKGRTTAAK